MLYEETNPPTNEDACFHILSCINAPQGGVHYNVNVNYSLILAKQNEQNHAFL